jgi:TetR/AcrR family transcriptional regulator
MHQRDAQQAEGVERLLAAARRLFAHRGFFGVSVEDLVQAAAVTRPVLYYHFHSKEGLYAAACEKAAAEYQAALEQAASGGGGVERIIRVCEAHALALWETTLLGEAPAPASEALGGNMTSSGRVAPHSRVVEVLRHLVGEGIRTAELGECDPESAAVALAGAAAAASSLAEKLNARQRHDRVVAAVAAVFHGLTPREPA